MSLIINGRELPYHLEVLYKTTDISFTNWTEDNDLDCNGADAVLGDTIGTIGKRLQDAGLIQGTTAA